MSTNKDHEIDDLRLRISQLEDLITSKSYCLSEPFSSTLNLNCSLPSTHVQTNGGLIDRISQLESLLAASELDNSRLNEKIALLRSEINRNHVDYEESLGEKEREIRDLSYHVDLLTKKNEVNERKIKSVTAYINTLPSQDELDTATRKSTKLEGQVCDLEKKVERLESKAASLQQELFQKERLYQDSLLKLDELKPLERAQESLLEDENLERLNYSNKEDVIKCITVFKAQLLRSKDVINSFRNKISKLNEDKIQYVEKINSQSLLLNESREQFLNVQFQMETLNEKLETLRRENLDISNNYEELQSRTIQVLKSREMHNEQIESMIKLVTEIDLCVSEMGNCLELSQKLMNGEEPDVESLVGLNAFDFNVDLYCENDNDEDEENSSGLKANKYNVSKLPKLLEQSLKKVSGEGDIDMEWCLERWEKVRTSRSDLANLRSQLNQMYARSLGGNVDKCPVQ